MKKTNNEINTQRTQVTDASIISYLRQNIGEKKYMGNCEEI